MPTLIAYAWIATVLVATALAAGRRIPIVNAFGWIDSRPGFYCLLVVLAVVSGLAMLQLASDAPLLNQAPVTWAALIALLYAWACIAQQFRQSANP